MMLFRRRGGIEGWATKEMLYRLGNDGETVGCLVSGASRSVTGDLGGVWPPVETGGASASAAI
jgi:hypothetical protein